MAADAGRKSDAQALTSAKPMPLTLIVMIFIKAFLLAKNASAYMTMIIWDLADVAIADYATLEFIAAYAAHMLPRLHFMARPSCHCFHSI